MDYLSDEEIDSMFVEPPTQQHETGTAIVPVPPVQLYPLSLAQAPTSVPNGTAPSGVMGFVQQKWGPLPAWAWLLLGGGAAGAGYLFLQKQKDGADGDEDKTSSKVRPNIGDVLDSSERREPSSPGGWEPSRSSFARQLEQFLVKKGHAGMATVYHDAEDAKRAGMTFVAPLINVLVKKGATVKVDTSLTRFCRKEGLNPVAHQDGSIGLYPQSSSKRGREWEEYVDALRDEGQNV